MAGLPNGEKEVIFLSLWQTNFKAKGFLISTIERSQRLKPKKEAQKRMLKRNDSPNGNAHRVITFLTREELDFLDKVGKDALFSAGTKLSRSKIISAIVNAIRKLGLDGCGLSSKGELERRIIKAMKNVNKGAEFRKDVSKQKSKEAENGPVF